MAQTVRSGAFSALRHSNFRWYFGGQLISITGSWMQALAQGWLVFQLTRSELALGVVACAAGIPSLFLSPFAGVIVDRFSRRTLLLITQTMQMILAFILAALVFANTVQVWHIVLLAFLLGLTKIVDAPARQAFIKDMVGLDDMSSGITLNSIMVNGGRVIGPSLAGILLATLGAGWCFFVNGVTFLAVLVSLLVIQETYRAPSIGKGAPIKQMREGLAFSRRHESILPLLLLAAVGSIFAVNTITLLPAFADVVLHSPVDGLSLLSAAQGVGAILGGLALAALVNHFGHGRVVSVMILLWSISIILLAISTEINLAMFLMAIFGVAFVLFFVNVNTMIQLEVPDSYRGRVMSLFTLTFLGLTPLSALIIGAIAEFIGTPQTLVLVGLANGSLALAILFRWRGVWRIA
ncbi:MAG: MFS transporter [Anaerolineae bacterium]|nr:MFS transporter [Anaerolineae bacterium]